MAIRRLICSLVLTGVLGGIGSASVLAQSVEDYDEAYQALRAIYADYRVLLSNYLRPDMVRNGITYTEVDYDGWLRDPLHARVMASIRTINPKHLRGADRMAFWINTYNILTIDLIIKNEEKESIRNLGGLLRNVWRIHDWEINDKEHTLHRIEHKILRPMGEPRVHYAINCASLSCPDLYEEPYEGSRLDAQLQLQEQRFMNNPSKGMRIVRKGGESVEIRLSKIFHWYDKDFGHSAGIIKLIGDYSGYSVGKNDIESLDYDWSLNGNW